MLRKDSTVLWLFFLCSGAYRSWISYRHFSPLSYQCCILQPLDTIAAAQDGLELSSLLTPRQSTSESSSDFALPSYFAGMSDISELRQEHVLDKCAFAFACSSKSRDLLNGCHMKARVQAGGMLCLIGTVLGVQVNAEFLIVHCSIKSVALTVYVIYRSDHKHGI